MDETADSSLVERAKAGDQSAFGALQGRYFEPVYDFAAHLTQSRDEAGEIAQETFVKAMDVLGGLRQGISFRSWIFGIARSAALSRLDRTSRTRPAAADDRGEVGFDVVDATHFADPAAAAVAPLVWRAAVGLGAKQLSLLDLHLRQGLDSDEVADVLGLTKENGEIMLNRLKRTAEDSMKAFIMYANGREYCRALDAALETPGPPTMSTQARKAVDRHAKLCPECRVRHESLAPLAAFGALESVRPPAGAREKTLVGLLAQWPGPAAGAGGGGGSRGRGRSFSDWLGSFFGGARRFIRVGAGLSLAAVILATILLAPASPIALTRSDGPPIVLMADVPAAGGGESPTPFGGAGGGPTRTATAPVTPVGGPATTLAATATPGPSSTAEPLIRGTAEAPGATSTPGPGAATATPATTPTATSPATATAFTATAVPTPIPTQTPCVPSLSPNTSALTIAPGGASFFFLSNGACGSAPFEVRSESAWLTVSPGSGSVGPFASVQVNVSVDGSKVPAGEGVYTGVLSIGGPGGSPFIVSVSTLRGGGSPGVSITQGDCSGSPVRFGVLASDDFGVSNVVVNYVQSNGIAGQKSLSRTSGGAASGAWSVSWELPPGGNPAITLVSYTIVATDGAGHSGQASGNC